jgi:hypothetical protein
MDKCESDGGVIKTVDLKVNDYIIVNVFRNATEYTPIAMYVDTAGVFTQSVEHDMSGGVAYKDKESWEDGEWATRREKKQFSLEP